MIILRKKRITFVLSCFVLSMFVFYLFKNNQPKVDGLVETTSLPISNKVIVVDARTSEHLMKALKVQMEQQKPKLT